MSNALRIPRLTADLHIEGESAIEIRDQVLEAAKVLGFDVAKMDMTIDVHPVNIVDVRTGELAKPMIVGHAQLVEWHEP